MHKGRSHNFNFLKTAKHTSQHTSAHVTPAYAHEQSIADKAIQRAFNAKPKRHK